VAGQQFSPHIFFGLDAMMVSTIILCITYAVIIWDKLNALRGSSKVTCLRVTRDPGVERGLS